MGDLFNFVNESPCAKKKFLIEILDAVIQQQASSQIRANLPLTATQSYLQGPDEDIQTWLLQSHLH